MECIAEEYIDVEHVNFSECLFPAHKLVYLKYMQLNASFIHSPESYPKLVEQLCAELNKISVQSPGTDWISLMKSWVAFVKEKCAEVKRSRKNFSFTVEDFELLNMVDNEKILLEPSAAELSCILDHLEIAHSSPKVWLTIALELEALGAQPFNEEQWKKVFEKWSNKVKRKKQILDDLEIDDMERNSFLSPLEQRLLEFLRSVKSKREKLTCRVCLQSKIENLKEIHEIIADEISIAQKICECANVQISKEDGLPQYICETCLHLLEQAYRFKSLCESSDYQLRNVSKTKEEEYVEYIIGDLEEIDAENLANLEDEDVHEDAVEINVTFEDEEKATEAEVRGTVEQDTDNSLSSLKQGKVFKEADTSVHQCELCGIICYNKVSLKKHMHTHTIERPHQCDICSKDFKTKLTLRIHMRSHTGERPYVCEVCGKAFTQDCTLSYHRSIHTGEKKYLCNKCDYRARNFNDLKIHMRTHTGARPYQCTLCPSKFTTSSNLQKHLRRHTGVKNFQCGNCGRSFFSRESARKHMVIHTGLKPYTCTECPMAYGWYNGLQKHMRTQHPGVKMPTEKHFLDIMEK